jgi:hypothetical protein
MTPSERAENQEPPPGGTASWVSFGALAAGRLPPDPLRGQVEDPGDRDGEDEADRQDHHQRSHGPVGRAEGGEHDVGDLGEGPRDRRVDGSGAHHLPTLQLLEQPWQAVRLVHASPDEEPLATDRSVKGPPEAAGKVECGFWPSKGPARASPVGRDVLLLGDLPEAPVERRALHGSAGSAPGAGWSARR